MIPLVLLSLLTILLLYYYIVLLLSFLFFSFYLFSTVFLYFQPIESLQFVFLGRPPVIALTAFLS